MKAFVGVDVEMLRTRVKAVELEAERLELAILFHHALETWPRVPSRDPRVVDVSANLQTYLRLSYSGPAAVEVFSIEHLAAALRFDR